MPDLEFDSSLIVDIQKLIEKDQQAALLNILIDLHPADIEDILNRLKKEDRKYLFNLLPTELASEVLIELDTPVVEQVLEEASEEKISIIVDQMDSDDAADIVAELPTEVAEKVLFHMEEEGKQEVQELLHYKEDTAGGIMALEFLSMQESATVNETIERIRDLREEMEDIYQVWVVDENDQLIGSVSLTELVLAKGYITLREIMEVELVSVRVDIDQEEVANLFRKYDLISVPVVDDKNRLVGRITVDDIVDVLEEEGSEDIARISGAPDEEILEESTFLLSRARLPWLLVAFVGEIIAAFILESFSATLTQKVLTAFFIPIVMAMGGSTGQQSSVIVVRGLATGDIELRDTRKRLYKEFKISLINSMFFSLLLFIIVYFWDGWLFATILSASMFIVINNAAIVGALIPLTFKRFKIDPALAAAPFVSTSNDIFGLLIYLTITTLSLKFVL
jgi:magnesium transporter